MTEPARLPDKLSDLAELALRDAETLDPKRYRPCASFYHGPPADASISGNGDGRCRVCLAGMLIAGTLQHDIESNLDSCDFDRETRYKLLALDYLRKGHVFAALDMLRQRLSRTETPEVRLAHQKAADAVEERTRGLPDKSNFQNWRAFRTHARWVRAAIEALRAEGC